MGWGRSEEIMLGETLFLTVEEAAGLLRIGRNAAYEAVRNGTIPSIRFGRIIRIPSRAILRLLDPENENNTVSAS